METVCPYCDRFFDVLDEIEGTRTRCDYCGQIFTVDRLVVLNITACDETSPLRGQSEPRSPPRGMSGML